MSKEYTPLYRMLVQLRRDHRIVPLPEPAVAVCILAELALVMGKLTDNRTYQLLVPLIMIIHCLVQLSEC
jgi:hypothetical protein